MVRLSLKIRTIAGFIFCSACFSPLMLIAAEAENASGIRSSSEFTALIESQGDMSGPLFQDAILNGLMQGNRETIQAILSSLSNKSFGQNSLNMELANNVAIRNVIMNIVDGGLMDDSWLRDKYVPHWWLGLYVLAAYYSEDPEVEAFLLRAANESPEIQSDILGYLTLGNFNSDEAGDFRLRSLDSSDINVARKAIRGIGLSDSPAKFMQLESQLSRRDAVLIDVVEVLSIIDMSKEQLKSILDKLVILKTELADYEGDWEVSDTDILRIDNALKSIQEKYDVLP